MLILFLVKSFFFFKYFKIKNVHTKKKHSFFFKLNSIRNISLLFKIFPRLLQVILFYFRKNKNYKMDAKEECRMFVARSESPVSIFLYNFIIIFKVFFLIIDQNKTSRKAIHLIEVNNNLLFFLLKKSTNSRLKSRWCV
jgi:hypothetical protein